MDYFGITVDAFKKVFKTDDAVMKHVSLFALTGILALLSEHVKASSGSDVSSVLLGGLFAVVISIYLFGYSLKFMHEAFNTENENIMPEFNLEPFEIFCGVLPLVLLWIVYIGMLCFVALIPFIGWLIMLVSLPVISIFLSFVFAAYAKNYQVNGLFNFFVPFKYARYSWLSIIIFGLLFIVAYIIILFVVFLAALIINLLPDNLSDIISGVMVGYVAYIVQLAWSYCIVQIYSEKIEENMDFE